MEGEDVKEVEEAKEVEENCTRGIGSLNPRLIEPLKKD